MLPEYCLLDIDGVLANFVERASFLHGVESPYYPGSPWLGEFNMARPLNLTQDEFWRPFNNHDAWAFMPVLDDAHQIIAMLTEFWPLKKIALCSTPSRSPFSVSGKLHWIQGQFPEFRRQYVFTPKKEILAHKDTFLIDDKDSNVDKFVAAGGKGLTVPRPWNEYHYVGDPVLAMREVIVNAV